MLRPDGLRLVEAIKLLSQVTTRFASESTLNTSRLHLIIVSDAFDPCFFHSGFQHAKALNN